MHNNLNMIIKTPINKKKAIFGPKVIENKRQKRRQGHWLAIVVAI